MTETIMVPFFDPGVEDCGSYPHKIELTEKYIEVWSFANVKYDDEDTGIRRQGTIDDQKIVLKANTVGVYLYQGVKYQNYVLRIYFTGAQDSDIFFQEKDKAKLVYNKIRTWLLA